MWLILSCCFFISFINCANATTQEFENSKIKSLGCAHGFTGTNCEIEQKSRRVTFLLALFFGGFGADKFYLLEPSIGVAKLVLYIISFTSSLAFVYFYSSPCGKTMGGRFMLSFIYSLLCMISIIWILADVLSVLIDDTLVDGRGYLLLNDL
jgi:TM2 domain-containing membrane protein YozV